MSRYLVFELSGEKPKTKIWNVLSKSSRDVLAEVKWYGPWRQYCVFFEEPVIFNKTCLQDLMDFLDQENKRQRSTWGKKKRAN